VTRRSVLVVTLVSDGPAACIFIYTLNMEAVPSSVTLAATYKGRVRTQAVTHSILAAEARSVDVGFVVDEAKPGQIYPEYFCFSC
jgi:hypothetical protein